MLASHGASV